MLFICQSNQAYNIYLIETPFLSSPKRTLSNELATTPISSHPNELITQHECEQFLNSLSQNDTKNLEKRILNMFETLILLPEYIDDVRLRLERIVNDSVNVFYSKQHQQQKYEKKYLSSIVECFSVGLASSRLLSLIEQRFQKDNFEFSRKSSIIRKKCSNPTDLGAQQVFSKFSLTSELFDMLNGLGAFRTPLEKIKHMHRILDTINGLLKITVEKSKSPLEKYSNTIFITSDDLISTLVYVLTNVQPAKFCSEMFFIESFNFTKVHNAELQYSLVTFQVAQSFILNFNPNQTNSSSSNHRSQSSFVYNSSHKQNKSRSSRNESKFDKEIEKISKLVQESSMNLCPKVTFDENLGSFLGSLADNFLIRSGNKNI